MRRVAPLVRSDTRVSVAVLTAANGAHAAGKATSKGSSAARSAAC